jgi:hypothetical protein
MNPILPLRDAIVARLVSMGKAASARYSPVLERKQLIPAKWFVAVQGDETRETNLTDRRDLQLDVVYQHGLPDPTEADAIPLENLAWLDAQINEVDDFRALFREDGALRGVPIADCIAIELVTMPLYLPNYLIDHSIFTSVTRIKFRYGA